MFHCGFRQVKITGNQNKVLSIGRALYLQVNLKISLRFAHFLFSFFPFLPLIFGLRVGVAFLLLLLLLLLLIFNN